MKPRRRIGRSLNLPRTFTSEAALATYVGDLEPGRVLHVLIVHDDECSRVRCVCSPTYELREGTSANFAEGERLQADWLRATAS